MKKLRVGLCGLGFMGKMHLASYGRMAGAEVVAICHASDRHFSDEGGGNLKQAKSDRRLWSQARRYASAEEMLAGEELDLVDICTPTFTHRQIACAALQGGVHVLCEKPMALSNEDCQEMIRSARSARRFLMVAHCLRWQPEYLFLRELINSEKYGRLQSLSMFRGSMAPTWAPWMDDNTKSGGPLLDLHIHDLDQLLWLLGKPAALSAVLSENEREGTIVYRYPKAVASVEFNGEMGGGFVFNMTYRAQFERATVSFDFLKKKPLTMWAEGERTHPKLEAVNIYDAEIGYMLECIREKRAPKRVTATDAAHAVAVALLQREAASKGEWQKVRW